jgi:hypothetical protein
MISENYEGKVIGGKVIDSVGVVSELNVIHVNFSDNTFERYGSVETLEAAIDSSVTGGDAEKKSEEAEESNDVTTDEVTDEVESEVTDEVNDETK